MELEWKGPVASDTSPFCLRRCLNIIGRNFKSALRHQELSQSTYGISSSQHWTFLCCFCLTLYLRRCGHHCFLSLSLLADFLLPCTVLTLNASIHSFIGQLFSAALVQHLPLASVIQLPACGLPSSKFQLLSGLSICSPSPSLN
jgi:hypothetical protein